ncbi:MAG: hypothetical protein QOK47_766 [Actinomycetota bacterium]|nr:hypothetical protein [Actinomycetota bacterium]
MKKSIAVLIFLCLFAIACGEPSGGSVGAGGASGGDDGSVSSGPISSGPDSSNDGTSDEGRPKMVKPRPGMAGLHKVGWDKAKPRKNGRKILVSFWSGVEPCYVLDHFDVEYGAKTVTITLWEGHDPAHEDEACIEIALLKGTMVKLSEPLGDRQIVDGAE